MNHIIKNLLGVVLIILALVVAGGIVSYVQSYSNGILPVRTFSVAGEGEVVAIPDVAQFSFGVITEGGEDIAALQDMNAVKMNAAISFVKDTGIKAEDIKTQSFQVEPRYKNQYCFRNDSCPVPEIVGYKIQQMVQVKVRDFTVIGIIMSGLVERGVNSISQLSFTIDDTTALENEAREKAIQQAQEKAEAVAEAGGFRVGRLVSVQESSPFAFGRSGVVSFEAILPTIEPGSQEVMVRVTLIYEIR